MRAAVLYGPEDLRIEDVPIPSIADDEVLVRVNVIGICPSDVRIYKGIYAKKYFPYGKESYGLSGHEWSGEVVRVGKNVRDFSPGDRVIAEILVPCGVCRLCKKGMPNLCLKKKELLRGYAEYVAIPHRNLLKIPDNVEFEEAALSEPISVCLHANDLASPKPGDVVLIIGAGPMGLLNLQIFKSSGAMAIISDFLESRLEVARDLGADEVINPAKESVEERLRELTNGYGADIVIVSVGNKAAIEEAFKVVGPGGKVILFGASYPPTTIEIDPNVIHYKEVTVMGCTDHLPIHTENALKLLSRKMINVKKLITHVLPLEKLEEGFKLVENLIGLKKLIKP